jgi:acyl-coenzyme A synthetase/AMP-(fatty) acid ligase/acyl carrier protein
MNSLPFLKQVRDASNQAPTEDSAYSFANQVDKHEVTHLQCTPSMARMLTINAESREMLKQIDHLMIGGEALPESLAKDLLSLNNSSLSNMYGPTETTIWSTTQAISSDTKSIPIGRPIANTKIYILDKFCQPTPPGVPGELFIGGDGVVRGYLNQPELTDERFIPNPFGDTNDERIYWTGDLACYRDDGVIDFLGRVDHQVKIRGYRIELGEIESALDQYKNIRQSVVVLREDTPGDQRLAAYYVVDGENPTSKELRETLGRSLPSYMMPSDFVALDALPLTPNGKVDRNALPSPQDIKPASEQVYVAPESGLEEKIVSLWQDTLKVDKVGTDDNFFDLGGHSLLVVKLHSELGKEVDKPISLTDLYRFPTVRSLVAHLGSSGASEELKKSSDRAERRRMMAKRRRRRA